MKYSGQILHRVLFYRKYSVVSECVETYRCLSQTWPIRGVSSSQPEHPVGIGLPGGLWRLVSPRYTITVGRSRCMSRVWVSGHNTREGLLLSLHFDRHATDGSTISAWCSREDVTMTATTLLQPRLVGNAHRETMSRHNLICPSSSVLWAIVYVFSH